MSLKFPLLVIVYFALFANGVKLQKKRLAGPPSEFDEHLIPKPFAGALTETSTFYKIKLVESLQNPGDVMWATVLNVDSSNLFAFTFFSPFEDNLQLTLLDPTEKQVDLNNYMKKGSWPIGEHHLPATTYVFKNPIIGEWNLVVTSSQLDSQTFKSILDSRVPHGAVLLWNDSPMKMYTYLLSYKTLVGIDIGLVSTMTVDTEFSNKFPANPVQLNEPIFQADMDVVLPDGSVVDVPMHDDGLHGDMAANDGIWGATITATEPGIYRSQAVFKAATNDGIVFSRTTQHLLNVVEQELELTGTATGQTPKNNRMSIHIGIKTTVEKPTEMWRAYAEVWGSNVPICWIGGMVDVEGMKGNEYVSLELDLNWINMANAKGPFTLKNVYISHASANVPVTTMDEIPVALNNEMVFLKTLYSMPPVTEITREMRFGIPSSRNFTEEKRGLILIHGYCSDRNPWQIQADDWTGNLGFFLNANSNIGNQEFSELVAAFAEEMGFTSFGAIGHSQGGMVALHLLNYYDTGLDYAQSGKRIQSVGTPYQGNSIAGSTADLGEIFGVGCGAVFDLTPDGAQLWLSGISKELRKEVSYYTTTYKLGNFFGDYCSLPANLALEWPNDGTCEKVYSTLDSATNMGNKEEWCHTTGMGYPAQYLDRSRNVAMNQDAAR